MSDTGGHTGCHAAQHIKGMKVARNSAGESRCFLSRWTSTGLAELLHITRLTAWPACGTNDRWEDMSKCVAVRHATYLGYAQGGGCAGVQLPDRRTTARPQLTMVTHLPLAVRQAARMSPCIV